MIMRHDRHSHSGNSSGTEIVNCSSRPQIRWKVAGILAIAIATPVAGLLVIILPRAAQAGAQAQDAKVRPTDVSAELAPFVTPIERRLTRCRERLARVASFMTDNGARLERLKEERMTQAIATESCKQNAGNATLAREVAEIAVIEYEEGVFKQDKATVEGELKLAESQLQRAKVGITKANERLAKIKEASRGSTADLANEYSFEDRVLVAQLEERRAEFAIEQAASKLKVLNEFTRPKTIKELKSEVEKARSVELAKRVEMEIAQGKLAHLEGMIPKPGLPVAEQKLLALLERGVGLDDAVSTKLDELLKNGKPDHELLKNIQNLTNELERVLEQAEAACAVAQLEKIKRPIREAAREYLGAVR